MTDRPIIFSAPMVRALLAGRKTQTRRLATSPLRRCEPGDRLYVREAWAPNEGITGGHLYRADYGGADGVTTYDLQAGGEPLVHVSRWRPSIHMPRPVSRLTLIVEGVEVEPVQAISRANALAEGVERVGGGMLRWERWSAAEGQAGTSPQAAFALLWDSLHDKPGERWADNPHVVALTFRVERCNIDKLEKVA